MSRATTRIPLSRPYLGEREEELVLDVLRSGRLSLGPTIERFEELIAERTGAPHAVALDGQDIRLRLSYAQRLWETERYVEAMDVWREVTNLAPQNVEARTALVRAYLRLRKTVEALSEYQEVVRLAPDHPDARRGFDALMQAERRSGPAPTSR